MKALGWREAKRNRALLGESGMQARDGGGQDGGGLTRPFARRHQVGRMEFDGHLGTHACVRTAANNMYPGWSESRVLARSSGGGTDSALSALGKKCCFIALPGCLPCFVH